MFESNSILLIKFVLIWIDSTPWSFKWIGQHYMQILGCVIGFQGHFLGFWEYEMQNGSYPRVHLSKLDDNYNVLPNCLWDIHKNVSLGRSVSEEKYIAILSATRWLTKWTPASFFGESILLKSCYFQQKAFPTII